MDNEQERMLAEEREILKQSDLPYLVHEGNVYLDGKSLAVSIERAVRLSAAQALLLNDPDMMLRATGMGIIGEIVANLTRSFEEREIERSLAD